MNRCYTHVYSSGPIAILQKYYLHREVKLKSEWAAKKSKKPRVEKKKLYFLQKRGRRSHVEFLCRKDQVSSMTNVLLLQTTNPVYYVTQDGKKSLTYKMTILRMESYTTRPKTRKWTLVVLSYSLDMARINSKAIYVTNNAKEYVDSFEFGLELNNTNMQTRLARESLSKDLHNSITHITGVENDKVEQHPPNDNTPRRCKMCDIASYDKWYKPAKDSIGKVKSRCS